MSEMRRGQKRESVTHDKDTLQFLQEYALFDKKAADQISKMSNLFDIEYEDGNQRDAMGNPLNSDIKKKSFLGYTDIGGNRIDDVFKKFNDWRTARGAGQVAYNAYLEGLANKPGRQQTILTPPEGSTVLGGNFGQRKTGTVLG